MGIIGIYVSIVLVAGRFLRMAVTDMHFRIMYDDINNCDMLLALVNDIKMCREVWRNDDVMMRPLRLAASLRQRQSE
jgi:hypothetical protein